MLEKSKGVVNAIKLHRILLLEADFNALYKILFNSRVILPIEKNQQILYEIIGKRSSNAKIILSYKNEE